jgi:EVE domain
MADWIFEGNPRHYDLAAAVASSREQWWGTPHFRDQMAVGDRVWLQVVGPKDPGIYYIATITSPTYEHAVEASEPRHFRWRTDIRFDYRVQPPLLRSELEEDAELGSFRPFRGFEGSNVPVPPDIASALAARAASRLEALRGLNVLPHRDVDGEAGPVIIGDLDGSEVTSAPGRAQPAAGGRRDLAERLGLAG